MILLDQRDTALHLWVSAVLIPWMLCKNGNHLSRENRSGGKDCGVIACRLINILLLEDDPYPKCFSRTEEDFTCFFEVKDNGTYNLFYSFDKMPKRCNMTVQRTEGGTFLHICSFPHVDVIMYVDIDLWVGALDNNGSLFSRVVSVEDQILLDPPFNVSLRHHGQAGLLQVSWDTKVSKYWKEKVQYKIRYQSRSLGQRTKEGFEKHNNTVVNVVPGEEVQVQVAVKCANNKNGGHWSGWSEPVRAMAPQSADDISLTCSTSDLQTITCRWNGSRYGGPNAYRMFHKMQLGEALAWTEWMECVTAGQRGYRCGFQGRESRGVRVKLVSTPPLSRTFYSQEFTLNKSIKTSPPGSLRGAMQKDKLCFTWEAPLPALSAHLQYEVGYQIKKHETWLVTSLKGPATSTCLEVPKGSHYSARVRAKPKGPTYSGYWSDWSDVFAGETPSGLDTLVMMSIPVTMLIAAVVLISLFITYFRKLKQRFWPPVPNPDKVLQGLMMDFNVQKWDLSLAAKQLAEETAASVVEVMSRDETSASGDEPVESNQPLSPLEGFRKPREGGPAPELKVFPNYVTVNKDSIIICPKGNKYVSEKAGADFLNRSYLPHAESTDAVREKPAGPKGVGNLYSNLPRT